LKKSRKIFKKQKGQKKSRKIFKKQNFSAKSRRVGNPVGSTRSGPQLHEKISVGSLGRSSTKDFH
jgi:hypothetical protein